MAKCGQMTVPTRHFTKLTLFDIPREPRKPRALFIIIALPLHAHPLQPNPFCALCSWPVQQKSLDSSGESRPFLAMFAGSMPKSGQLAATRMGRMFQTAVAGGVDGYIGSCEGEGEVETALRGGGFFMFVLALQAFDV